MLSETLKIDGRTWHVHHRGEASAPALLLLHGFTGSGRSWQELAEMLPDWRIIAPDLPGHGKTDPPAGAMPEVARDLVALLDRLGVSKALVIGYSMGGRLALHLAVHAPERILGLVVIGASPGLPDEEARAARRSVDEQLALRIETDLDGFVGDWEALPLFGTQRTQSPETRERIRETRRSHDPQALAAALRHMGTGAQPPLHDRLGELAMPMLWITGEYDAKFRAIAQSVAPRLPSAHFAIVPYAGHAVHVDRPSAVVALLGAFRNAYPGISLASP